MKSNMTIHEYLKKLNELNETFGLALKYNPATSQYIVEDQDDFDYEPVDMSHDYGTNKVVYSESRATITEARVTVVDNVKKKG